ncbi:MULTISPECIES: biosynthetic peptidoglycan transglycosylase [unclassified Parabacteroides]|uniref:biosynthetic peptidoglycan transglycosylase n=1 Tax=unclassified Parabacteroides TaxID=2649774 RepID=UPI00247333EB|nr:MULTISPECIES: biosynthetic peptidoglycan transglycosylase [unclassified Parabacteroides]
MKLTYQKFRIVAIIILLLLLALLQSGNLFVRFLVKPELQAIEKKYDVTIQYNAILLKGLSNVQIKGLTLTPKDADRLLKVQSFVAHLDFNELLKRKIRINSMEADKVEFSLTKEGSDSNFDLLYRLYPALSEAEETIASTTDYAAKIGRAYDMLSLLPDFQLSVKNLFVSYQKNDRLYSITIPELLLDKDRFNIVIQNEEGNTQNEWICRGTLQEDKQKLSLRLFTEDPSQKIALPFIRQRWDATALFDTLALELTIHDLQPDVKTLTGKGGIKGLVLYQESISPDSIYLDRGFINYRVHVGPNFAEVDSSATTVYFNKLKLSPYLRIEKNKDWHIRAALDKKDFPADDLFSSIPKGFFYNIEGLKAEGTLNYHFLLDVDMTRVENLRFESSLQSHNFRILQYGRTDLRKMNSSFLHTIYEKGKPVRTFRLGSENPDFRPYRSISRYLPMAIMHAEDAGFMHHRGFIPDAFRRSLVQDLLERRFARGGSTLSMQLVKNVFLSRNKTIVRKLEEIMIVWLIETCRLTSKERMFEVYMNVIEWGPNVYGVTEAARYYFGKTPSQLTLGECVFLSYIIADPKRARRHFYGNGTDVKPAFHIFYRDAVKRMLQRGWISPAEAAAGNPHVAIIPWR